MSHEFLFVCGVARSGTSATTELLNRHPSIALGMERYKKLPPAELSPALFEEDRFFDIRETDTNIKQPRLYERLRAKYATATIVGDKVPRYYSRYKALMTRFPQSKVIYVLRDITAVALSWDARANEGKEAWPAENNYEKAVLEWNNAIQQTLKAREEYGRRLIIISYDDLFFGQMLVLQRLMRRLDLKVEPTIRKYLARNKSSFKKSNREPSKKQRSFIEANADMAAYEQLREQVLPSKPAGESAKAKSAEA